MLGFAAQPTRAAAQLQLQGEDKKTTGADKVTVAFYYLYSDKDVTTQNRNNEADFLLEKSKLLDVLTIIKAADPSTYTKYFKFGEVEFHTD